MYVLFVKTNQSCSTCGYHGIGNSKYKHRYKFLSVRNLTIILSKN